MGDRVEQRLGNYRLVRLLGRGSFAEVYLGEHTRLKSYAALKVLRRFLSEQDQEDFLAEGRMLVRLKHQHIVRLLDFDIKDDTPFLVMEYAPGGTLRKLHPKKSCVPLVNVVAYVRQVAEALDYAHERAVIHRDIKPENMLLGAQGEILLGDFGIATIAHTTRSFRTEPAQAGTLPYMAPEQLRKHPRPASDQYALAIVTYEWLCGERPFAGAEWTLIFQHMHTPPPRLRERLPDLPQNVEDVVLRALAKDPHERFACVRDFALALSQAAGLTNSADLTALSTPGNRPTLISGVLTDTLKVPDFSTFFQEEQSPAHTIALLPSVDPAPITPELVSHSEHSSGPRSLPTASQPQPTSWLQGTWTQRLILLLLSLSLIAASLDIAFTLASWQRLPLPQDGTPSAGMRPTGPALASQRQEFYRELTSRKADIVLPLTSQHTAPWDQGPGCRFGPDGYHVNEGAPGNEQDCLGQMTHFGDFVLQVHMTILHGDSGGLLFRAYFNPRLFYRFQITTSGSYSLSVKPGSEGPGGRSTAINRDPRQGNTLTVIARDDLILLYINGQYVDQMRDRQSLSGSIGVCALRNRGSPSTEVVFRDAKVWEL